MEPLPNNPVSDTFMVAFLVTLIAAAGGTAYMEGRWTLSEVGLILVLGIPITFILASMIFVARGLIQGSRWVVGRFVVVLLIGAGAVISQPFMLHLARLGQEHHVQSIFTPQIVEEVRALAARRLAERGEKWVSYFHRAKEMGLPPAVASSSWGMPSSVVLEATDDPQHPIVDITWGGALSGHHGFFMAGPPKTDGEPAIEGVLHVGDVHKAPLPGLPGCYYFPCR